MLPAIADTAARTTPLTNVSVSESLRRFGTEFPYLHSLAVGERWKKRNSQGPNRTPAINVQRDQVVAFAVWTQGPELIGLNGATIYNTGQKVLKL